MDAVRKATKGYTLITTMLVMIILFVIGIAGAMLVYYGNMTSAAMINYQKAYYNADYGLQQVAYNAMNNVCNCQNNGCGMYQPNLPTGGTVQVITQSDTSNRTCFIEATGTGQTGGEVIKAIAISTGASNWAALGMLNGTLSVGGSAAINGCDYVDQCEAAGILQGSNLTINVNQKNLYTCQNNKNPQNPQGVVGSPTEKQTTSTDVTQLITQFNSFSDLQNYIQNQVANYTNQYKQCYCGDNATASGSSITCDSTPLPSSCTSYYIGGTLTVDSYTFGNNQVVYANNIDINGNNLNIQGGLLYVFGTLTIGNTTNGNTTIGSSSSPTTLIAQNANIDIGGKASINGLLMINNLSDFSIGDTSVSGALYVNNASNGIDLSGNTSINFNYAILQTITSAFPKLFIPINCYSQGPQQVMLNAVTIY